MNQKFLCVLLIMVFGCASGIQANSKIDSLNKELKAHSELDDTHFLIMNELMIAHVDEGNNGKAFEWANEYLKDAERLGDPDRKIVAYRLRLELYSNLRKLGPDSIPAMQANLDKLLELLNDSEDSIKIGRGYAAIGNAYFQMGKEELALKYLKMSLVWQENETSMLIKSGTSVAIVKMHVRRGEFAEGIKVIDEALALQMSVDTAGDEGLENMAGLRFVSGWVRVRAGENKRAVSELLLARAYAKGKDRKPLLRNVLLSLPRAYANMGDFENAYVYQQELVALLKEKRHRATMDLVRQNEGRLKSYRDSVASANVIATNEAEIKEGEASRNLLLLGAAALALILGLTVFFLFRSRRDRRQISDQNTQLDAALREKETLLKEIHHRVKNNLQIISNILEFQSYTLDDDRMRAVTIEGQNRVKSMAMIHKRLYESDTLRKIPFQQYLEDLSGSLAETYRKPGQNIETKVESADIALEIDTAVPLGLIVNELLTNSFKYAFEGRSKGNVRLGVSRVEGGYRLSVEDDGVGMPEGFDPRKSDSLGLDLVLGLARQLDGKAELVAGEGTHWRVDFREPNFSG
ncbi:MAG: sensor histidine kinase [Bacteroidota bacterium]